MDRKGAAQEHRIRHTLRVPLQTGARGGTFGGQQLHRELHRGREEPMTTTTRATTRCLVEHHDHFVDTFDDPDAATCADCGEPVHYDERADDYRHDDVEHECFLHRGGDGCSLVELTWSAWARSNGVSRDDALDLAAGIDGLWIVQRTTGRTAFEHELHGDTIEITCRGVDLLAELTMHDGGGYADAGLWAVLS